MNQDIDVGMIKTMALDRIKALSPAIDEMAELMLTIDRMIIQQKKFNAPKQANYSLDQFRWPKEGDLGIGRQTRHELVAAMIDKANRLCDDQSTPDKDIPDISARDAGVAELFVMVLLFAAYNEIDLAARVYDRLLFDTTRRQPIRDAVVPEKIVFTTR